jgi:hypothetical protein
MRSASAEVLLLWRGEFDVIRDGIEHLLFSAQSPNVSRRAQRD